MPVIVNVILLTLWFRERRRSRSRSLRKVKRRPRTISEVMRVLHMEDHLPVFVLNGYENLSLFKDMDDPELDYLGIVDPIQVEVMEMMSMELNKIQK